MADQQQLRMNHMNHSEVTERRFARLEAYLDIFLRPNASARRSMEQQQKDWAELDDAKPVQEGEHLYRAILLGPSSCPYLETPLFDSLDELNRFITIPQTEQERQQWRQHFSAEDRLGFLDNWQQVRHLFQVRYREVIVQDGDLVVY